MTQRKTLKPVSFTPAMVSAIQGERKYTTRRILQDGREPGVVAGDVLWVRETHYRFGHFELDPRVGETRRHWRFEGFGKTYFDKPPGPVRYGMPGPVDEKYLPQWYRRPPMFMFQTDCRLWLRVTRVTTEQLHEMLPIGAKEEGIASVSKDGHRLKFGIPDRDGLPGTDNEGWPWPEWESSPVAAFRRLWGKIHGPDAWDLNPRVAVIEFKMTTAPG